MDAAPSLARGVSEKLAPVPRVAAAADAGRVTPPEIRIFDGALLLSIKSSFLAMGFLVLAMELMMGEEPIASERGECSSNG